MSINNRLVVLPTVFFGLFVALAGCDQRIARWPNHEKSDDRARAILAKNEEVIVGLLESRQRLPNAMFEERVEDLKATIRLELECASVSPADGNRVWSNYRFDGIQKPITTQLGRLFEFTD